MSAKSRYKNRSHNRQSISSTLNTSYQEISALAQQMSSASPFEQAQLQCLQTMIELLAEQVLSSMKQKDANNPNGAIPLLRIYAQYLNLYMKFKDKCFKQNQSKSGYLQQPAKSTVNKAEPVTLKVHIPIQKTENSHFAIDIPPQHRQESKQQLPQNKETDKLLPTLPATGMLIT